MRIFVYEHITAGGLGPDAPASLRREGRAMLEAVVADFQKIANVSVTTLIDRELGYDLGDVCMRIDEDDVEESFDRSAAACDVTLVIAPEQDNILLDCCQAVLDVGGRLLGPSPAAVQLAGDKLALAEFWRLRGVPHPYTDSLDHADFARIKPPWILKPRFGAGSQGIYLLDDERTAQRIIGDDADIWAFRKYLAQDFIPGEAASVSLLCGPDQAIPLLPARQHLSNDGRFRYQGGSLPLPTPLAQRATKLALQAVAGIDGMAGYVGVDLVLGDDGDYLIEINPRLTTSYLGLRQLCQQNLAELMLQCALGESIGSPTWHAGEVRFLSEPERQRGV